MITKIQTTNGGRDVIVTGDRDTLNRLQAAVNAVTNPPSYYGQGGVSLQQHVEEDLFPPPLFAPDGTQPAPADSGFVTRDTSTTLLNASGGEEVLPLPPTLNFTNPLTRREKKSAPAAPAPVVSAQGGEGEEDLPAPSLNNYFETRQQRRRREAVGSR